MTEVPLGEGLIARPRKGGEYRALLRMLWVLTIAALLLSFACAKSVSTTTTSTTKTTSTAVAATTTTASTSKMSARTTTPSATPTTSGPYGSLTIATGSFGNENWDPIAADGVHRGNGLAPIMDPIFLRSNLEPAPGVVEKWELAADGLSWTFYVRKGIRFHNGDDLTAKDVKFSLDRESSRQAFFSDFRRQAASVSLVDDYTVRILTNGRQPYLPYTLTSYNPGQGWVQPKNYIEQNGIEYYKQHPIGSGAYKFVSNVRGDIVQYEALDKHWQHTAAFKKLTRVLIPEEATRVAMLKTGGADVIEISVESGIRLDKDGFKTYLLDTVQPVLQLHGAYDQRAKGMPIADLRVRQALSLSINRQEIDTTFFSGKVGPIMPAYISLSCTDIDRAYWQDYAAKAYRYDPTEASRLLKEAGYAQGFTFKSYLFPAPATPWLPQLGEILQGYWLKIGVKAEIVPIDMATYTSSRKGPAPLFVGNATLFRRTSAVLPLPELDSGFSGAAGLTTLFGIGTPEATKVEQLIAAGNLEMDAKKRKDIVADIMRMTTDSYTAISISSAATPFGVGPNVDIGFPIPPDSPYLPTLASRFTHR